MTNPEDQEEGDDVLDIDRIAEVRRWLSAEADKLALSSPDHGFLHSSLKEEAFLWEYDRRDLSDFDDIGLF